MLRKFHSIVMLQLEELLKSENIGLRQLAILATEDEISVQIMEREKITDKYIHAAFYLGTAVFGTGLGILIEDEIISKTALIVGIITGFLFANKYGEIKDIKKEKNQNDFEFYVHEIRNNYLISFNKKNKIFALKGKRIEIIDSFYEINENPNAQYLFIPSVKYEKEVHTMNTRFTRNSSSYLQEESSTEQRYQGKQGDTVSLLLKREDNGDTSIAQIFKNNQFIDIKIMDKKENKNEGQNEKQTTENKQEGISTAEVIKRLKRLKDYTNKEPTPGLDYFCNYLGHYLSFPSRINTHEISAEQFYHNTTNAIEHFIKGQRWKKGLRLIDFPAINEYRQLIEENITYIATAVGGKEFAEQVNAKKIR